MRSHYKFILIIYNWIIFWQLDDIVGWPTTDYWFITLYCVNDMTRSKPRRSCVGLMLAHHLRRWSNNKATLTQPLSWLEVRVLQALQIPLYKYTITLDIEITRQSNQSEAENLTWN